MYGSRMSGNWIQTMYLFYDIDIRFVKIISLIMFSWFLNLYKNNNNLNMQHAFLHQHSRTTFWWSLFKLGECRKWTYIQGGNCEKIIVLHSVSLLRLMTVQHSNWSIETKQCGNNQTKSRLEPLMKVLYCYDCRETHKGVKLCHSVLYHFIGCIGQLQM